MPPQPSERPRCPKCGEDRLVEPASWTRDKIYALYCQVCSYVWKIG